jgi:pSer/pThr/pTyr-binding forkhead associated (FHA) protein
LSSDDPTKPMHPADVYKFEREEAVKKGSIIIYFEDETRVFDLLSPETRISIGRGSDMDVIIDDENLSRLHARFIYRSDKGLNVTDLGSSNGTIVNGRTLRENESVFLSSGNEVFMGGVRAVVALMGERSRVKPPAKFTMQKIAGAQNLVLVNPAMKAVYQQVAKVAEHDAAVLITGETTGRAISVS